MKHLNFFICLFLLLFFVGSSLLFSQVKKQKYFIIYLNHPEDNCSIKAEVYNKKSKIRYSDTLKYYWYSADKIIATQGASEGKVLHGKYSSFYYNNNLKEQGRYKKGLQNGQWMKWNNTGNLQEISHWHKGFRQGKHTLFDSLGNKASEKSYRKGRLHGAYINYANGKVTSKKQFINGVEVLPGEEKMTYRVRHNLKSFFGKIANRLKPKSEKESTGSDSKTEKEINSKEKQDKKKHDSKPKSERKTEKAIDVSPQTKPGSPVPPARSEK